MSSLNKVFLMGNLTRDPELRYAASGTAIASFGMAINRKWESKDGEKKEEVCFVEVTMFGKRAEVINEYFSKGKPIFIEGRLSFSQWETESGDKRSTLKVTADNFQFIGGDSNPVASNAKPSGADVPGKEIPF